VSRPAGGRVEINLGKLCNNRCVFCISGDLRDRKGPWMPIEEVKEELRHFYLRGCRSLGFLGGEPTVYPHILECVGYARSLGYSRISLCSNGTRLSDPGFCRSLVSAGMTRVTLSVHSHRQELEDLITGVPGNFARKLAAVSNLLALSREGLLPDKLSLNPVLSRRTLGEMGGYVLFYSGLGVRDIRFNYIWPPDEWEQGHPEARAWVPAYREAMPEILRILLLNEKRWGLRLSFGGVPRCALSLVVSPRLGRYLAAKYLDEASLDPPNEVSSPHDRGGRERFLWQERKRDVLKTMAPSCRSCRHFSGCEGIWRTYVRLYGFGEFKPLGEHP